MNVLQIVISCLVLLVLDITWIMLFMRHKYNIMIPRIQNNPIKLNIQYALFAYLLMLFGLIWFVVRHIKNTSILEKLKDSFLNGFLFGITIYGIYNCTAGSIFANWNLKITLIDCMWGGFVYFISAFIGSLVNKQQIKN